MPSILHTKQGGTGSSSVPSIGQIPVADTDGNYQPTDPIFNKTGTTITPHTPGDDLNMGSGHIYSTGTYGEIYGNDNTTPQSIPSGTTYTKIVTAYTQNGIYSNTTVDESNGKITIIRAGKYRVFYTLSYSSGANNANWYGAVFYDGVECNNIHSSAFITTGNDRRTTAAQGIISCAANKEIDFRIRHDQATATNITPTYINLNVEYLGE